MALSINPNFVPGLARSAVASAGIMAAQHASPTVIKAAQRIFSALRIAESVFGQQFVDTPIESLGGLTPNQLKAIHGRIRDAGPARKNLFFVRLTDGNPPKLPYGDSATATGLLDLLVLDVSYGTSTLTGEKVAVGSGMMDQVTGSEAIEMQITTMDDGAGTLKRWFDAKVRQAAHDDGTFGLPADYVVTIEVVHGVASPEVPGEFIAKAYKKSVRMRPVSCQHELSRRDQAPSELQMTFTQVDTWLDAKPSK